MTAVCGEPDCDRPFWSILKHGRTVVVSNFCRGHSHFPLFDMPAERMPRGKLNSAAAFRAEAGRQRLAHERHG